MTRARATRTGLLVGAALLAVAPTALGAPGDLTIVSRSTAGALGASPVDASAVSADGRFVAFTSAADLSGTATGGKVQLYVRDRTANTTALASSAANGAAANGDVETDGGVSNTQFAISGDGRYVVFASSATNLSPADADTGLDVFRKDLQTGAVTLVSVNSAGAKANGAVLGDPDVSWDGNRIVFGSGAATNLFGADANAANSDTVVRDVTAGTTVLAAQSTGGVQANGGTERPAISADGRVVVFTATNTATNLSPGDTGAGNDIYVRNLAAGTTSPATDPAIPNGSSNFPDISGDGRYVVWETGDAYDATNDVGANDVYRRDMGTGAVVLVSARDGVAGGGNNGGVRPQIAANGDRVTFSSTSTDLTVDANAATADVFTRDVEARTTRLASVNGTNQGATDTRLPAIAANGGLVAFLFTDGALDRLVTGDTNLQPDAHAKELTANDATPPALALTGPADGATVSADRVAVGGTVSDPSGVVSLTVGGAPVALTPSGGFSASLALSVGTNPVVVVARDGAGNTNVIARTVTRPAAPVTGTPLKKTRLLGLAATLTKAGKLRVTVRLSAAAKVRVSLLRRTVKLKPRRVVVLRSAAPVITRTLKAGRRTVLIAPRKPLAFGRYVVRVRVLSPVSGPAVRNLVLKVVRAR